MVRQFTPDRRDALPPDTAHDFTATHCDDLLAGIAAVANAATRTYFAADQTHMLALNPAPNAGDLCVRDDLGSDLWTFLGGDPTNIASWQAPPTTGVSSVNTRTGAVVLNGADIPVFGASGSSHAPGAVPDPGASAGTNHFLREDASWAVPAGVGFGIPPWYVSQFTPPVLADFAWTNQASATATDQTGQLTMTSLGTGSSNSVHILDQAYTVGNRAVVVPIPAYQVVSTTGIAGIIIRNSSNGKFLEFSFTTSGTDLKLRGVAWSSPTDAGPTVLFNDSINWLAGRLLMLSVRSDGTTVFFDISMDGGQNWDNYFSETVASFLGATDRAGFHCSSIQTQYSRANFVHWSNS